jgi:dihydroorotate dehydrogenase
MFNIALKFLQSLSPETAHHAAIHLLKWVPVKNVIDDIHLHEFAQICMGLHFSHPIGFAAGFDKDAEVFHQLGKIGFSFVETGTITPFSQPGNPKPRVFRIPEKEAIINSYGFNSKGAAYASNNIKKIYPHSILGVNLGINKNTINPIDDFLKGVETFVGLNNVHYFTLNVSSPNTPGLRDLQTPEYLKEIITGLKDIIKQKNLSPPLIVKLSPDMSLQEETKLIEFLLEIKIDGMMISNTTLSRPGLEKTAWASLPGGLSGKPLKSLSTEMLKRAYHITRGQIPLIGCGGVSTGQDAYEKICAGANLLQLYTAFIYKGPLVLRNIIMDLKKIFAGLGIKNISEIIGSQ